MSAMSGDQTNAFQTSGFTPEQLSTLVAGFLMAVLLVWGAWAISLAYKGWCKGQVDKASLTGVVARFLLLYLIVGALVLT